MLTDIQKSLNGTTCPVCNTGKLIAILRCDLDPGACIAKANCNNCDSTYHLNEKKNEDGEQGHMTMCEVNGMVCNLVKV